MRNRFLSIFLLLFSFSASYAQNCQAPVGLLSTAITANSAVAVWQIPADASSYTFEYRIEGTTDWTILPSAFNAYTLFGLDACTNYEMRVQTICSNGQTSDWTAIVTFMTTCLGGCDAPLGQLALNVTETDADLNWLPAGDSYIVRHREVNTADWTTVATVGPMYMLSGLEACKTYEWNVASVCGTDTSVYSNPTIFDTYCGQCDPPTGMTVSAVSQTSAVIVWPFFQGPTGYQYQWRKIGEPWQDTAFTQITSVSLNDLEPCTDYRLRIRSNCGGTDVSAWGSVLNFSTECSPVPCDPVANLTIGTVTGGSIELSWDAFSSADTYVVQTRTSTSAWVALDPMVGTNIVVDDLTNCTDYSFRVQTVCGAGLSSYSSIVTETTTCIDCPTVTGLEATNIDFTSATLNWVGTQYSDDFKLQYRIDGGSWITEDLTATSFDLTDLEPCTEYRFRVQNNCADLNSGWTTAATFNTACCDIPEVAIGTVGDTDVSLSVSNLNSFASTYTLLIESAGTSDEYMFVTGMTNPTITDLDTCTMYNVSVKAECGMFQSSYSTVSTFMTNCTSGALDVFEESLQIFPNPTSDFLTIKGTEIPETVKVIDMEGRVVLESNGVHYNELTLDLKAFPAGTYFLRFMAKSESITRKITIVR